ncbi:MAG: TIGR02186 family protein [Rhodospirillales bacterium]|nr:TIGR02186 family protein [Rhodospirillales bacterium]MDE0382172.1 TIGR02186 family protein [Rhodospirillales bacterium]MDE0388300.1 TIGR02186 family protein [Rhodospirillales bacterium]
MRRWPRYLAWAIVAAALAVEAGTHAAAQEEGSDEPLLIALSTQRIEIDSNFAGTSILLFGATDVVGDVVVSVRGPEEPVVVRRKRQSAGVWINQEAIAFRNVPGYYFVAASRPLEEIAPAEFLDRKQLGSQRLLLEAIWFDTSGDANEFRAALHRDRERDSLYRSEPGTVEFIDERLFRTTIDLPAHVPTGDYVVEAMLMVGGEVLSTRTEALSIEKAGFSADISTFARADEALYGVIAIALALVAGWLGSFAFRKG